MALNVCYQEYCNNNHEGFWQSFQPLYFEDPVLCWKLGHNVCMVIYLPSVFHHT